MVIHTPYKFLEQRPGSNYRQLFLRGRNLLAEVLYRATIGPEPRTPDEVAHDYDVPREAVEEAVDYCLRYADVLRQERQDVLTDIGKRELDKPPCVPVDGVSGAWRLYLDDNLTDRRVVAQLQRAGHTVVLPAEVGHAGTSDAQHFTQAIRHTAVLLTRNYKDFIELHDLIHTAEGSHPGLLLIYLENDPMRDMTPRSIAGAVSRLEAAAVPLVNHVYVLNHWR